MDEVTMARAIRAHADAEAEERRLLAALQAGDETVSGATLAAAEAETRAAALRVEAARRIAAEEAEAERVRRIAAVRATLAEHVHADYALVLDRFDQATEALREFGAAVSAANDRLNDVHQELSVLRPLPADLDPNIDGGIRVGEAKVALAPFRLDRLLAEMSAWVLLEAGIDLTIEHMHAAGLAADPSDGALYGVGRRPDGSQRYYGPSHRLRWLTNQLATAAEEN